jgi:flagellar hook-associated protein 2
MNLIARNGTIIWENGFAPGQEGLLGISFGSIGTGLPKDIVQQIMNAEKMPLKNMENRKSKANDKKNLVTELVKLIEDVRGKVAASNTYKALLEYKVDTNNDLVGVTVDKDKAKPGVYNFEVDRLAQKSSGMTSGFKDKDESYVGVGFIQYELPNGDTKDIYIDEDNASLTGVAALINKDSQIGVRASVVNDGSGSETPWRLILSLSETGDEMKANFPYFYFVDGDDDFYLEFEREAHDAKIKLDGFEIELKDNKATDIIPGVTIDLKKAKEGDEFQIKISEDKEAITKKFSEVVEKINGVLAFIKKQNTLDEKSDTSRTLGGDITLQTIESKLRRVMFTDIMTNQGPRKIGDLGLTFQRDGLIAFDEKRFDAVISKSFGTVAEILTGAMTENGPTNGFINNIQEFVNTSIRMPEGVLQNRKKTFQNNIDQIDRQIANKQRSLDQKEQSLKDKFSRLESTISRFKNQASGLASLGSSGADPVNQLG